LAIGTKGGEHAAGEGDGGAGCGDGSECHGAEAPWPDGTFSGKVVVDSGSTIKGLQASAGAALLDRHPPHFCSAVYTRSRPDFGVENYGIRQPALPPDKRRPTKAVLKHNPPRRS